MTNEIWWHGTEVTFNNWLIPDKFQPHKNGMESHSAIFFASDQRFALGASHGTGLHCSARLMPEAKIIDMNRPQGDLSEVYRNQVMKKPIGSKNPQVIFPQYWSEGWLSGKIMKYAPTSEDEIRSMQHKAYIARTQKHTAAGAAAFNELQLLTRSVIEELVISARELGFDAVIGNEIDTLQPTGSVSNRIMFALNPQCLCQR